MGYAIEIGGVPMNMNGAPPSYAAASAFAGMPGQPAGQPVQLTPIAQSPHVS
jgi:hypothetical protein